MTRRSVNSFDSTHLHLDGGNDMNREPTRCGIGGYIDLLGQPGDPIKEPRLTSDPTKITCPDCREIHLAEPAGLTRTEGSNP